ncbi:flavodoxin family protein (plasmid) [Chloroflexota bacterium]|nr:flavodoxin family protein [Chloroflexota bacterium]
MKIGVIYYSYSGHTALVVDQLVTDLNESGAEVSKIVLEPESPLQLSAITVPLKVQPDVSGFDVLILGTPVHGGRMSAPMLAFLEKIPTLEGKQVAYLLTHFFPRKWGAAQTIEVMKGLCWERGGKILGSADVTWLSLRRKKRILGAVEDIKTLLTAEN